MLLLGFAPSRTMREINASFETGAAPLLRMSKAALDMSKHIQGPPLRPRSQELRKEIDAIDEQVHRLLMARGDIIDRLIQVKQTQEVGSAFRPAREAGMMRRAGAASSRHPAARHHREHLARHHLDLHLRAGAVFGACGCFGRRIRDAGFGAVSFRLRRCLMSAHFSAQAAVEAVAKSKGDLALVSATSSRTPWWIALEADGAPKIIARLPFLERADHPAALPVFVVSRVADNAMVTEVEIWSVRVSGWNAEIARALAPLAEIVAVPDTAFDGAALLVSVAGTGLEKIKTALIQAGASVRSSALVGSHATRYTVPPNGAAKS